MEDKYFIFFSNCFLIKGYSRSLIIDPQRGSFVTIPNSLYEIITLLKEKNSISKILNSYPDEVKTINNYISYLIEKEYGFIGNSKEFDLFINYPNKFETPYLISNVVYEVTNKNITHSKKIFDEIQKLNCRNIQLIFYDITDIDKLKIFFDYTKEIDLRSIEVIVKYTEDFFHFLTSDNYYNKKITQIIFHTYQKTYTPIIDLNFEIIFLEEPITDFKSCGNISNNNFNHINQLIVLESINHNSCLHKKLSIDKDGNIKNCPAMAESFGNIQNTSLINAINIPDFKKYWNITKDQIEVCKDCEFRHICTDCRAFIEAPTNQYSKPLKCGYNPYTCKWEEWSTNPLKQKAIEFYGMQEIL